jgi:hypothetical protein
MTMIIFYSDDYEHKNKKEKKSKVIRAQPPSSISTTLEIEVRHLGISGNGNTFTKKMIPHL